MKKFTQVIVLILFSYFPVFSQKGVVSLPNITRPKLVIGIVVDQMRWDYLYRYQDRYSEKGFKRLMSEGFSCENTIIPYLPTYTAPGHTCIYTGSVPAIHGIIGNDWYNRITKKIVYCTDDTVTTVGSSSNAGKMSPVNLWTTTITDELRLATNFRSKVIGIALKDRGAILPAGHSANGAYWFDNSNGSFISCNYYMKSLPQWVDQFNNKKLPDDYLQQNWNTLYPINTYIQSTEDNKSYEAVIPGEGKTFPHNTSAITKDKYNVLRYTPMGNNLTMEMAMAAIKGEQLGKSGNTDFLTISFSSTDYIGHAFGPNSIEVEDTYLRLDKTLGDFIDFLNLTVGKGQYTLFLTADHGVAHVPAFDEEEGHTPGGNVREKAIKSTMNDVLEKKMGIKNAIEAVINYQVYLSDNISDTLMPAVTDTVIKMLMKLPYVANAVDLKKLNIASLTAVQKNMLINGYNQKLSGDIQFILKPQWVEGSDKGTTHGSWNPYDSHIPLLWYGWGVNKGHTNRETEMTDIAATLAALLHIQMPSGCIGKVVAEVIR